MITARITREDNGRFATIANTANQLNGGVSVGYWQKQGVHRGTAGKRPITLAELATIHEKGAKHIPKRSFVSPALTANKNKYKTHVFSQITGVLEGNTPVNRVWKTLGEMAVGDVKQYMTTANFTPLKPETIKRKGSSKPLIDTGHLKKAITYEVK